MRQGSHRHPVQVEAIGVMQHGKHKTYMFSVLWSDHNKVLIYRTFEEFKNFQKELKQQFPLESGVLNKSERIIPKLKGAPRPFAKKKESKKFLETLERLETYSQTLLNLDAKISQCDLVVHFFTLKDNDLKPSFSDNSIVIMPSEKKEEKTVADGHIPEISGPLVASSFLCIEDFESIDLKNRPFRVKRNQILDVLLRESTGWWLVENEDRQLAWFPAPYLKVDRDADENSGDEESQEEGTLSVVVKAHEAQNPDEISVSIGTVVEVLKKSDSGWWLIRYNTRKGYIPSAFLKPYANHYERFQNILRRERNISVSNLLPNQREDRSNPEERERSQSLGSEARSYIDSDVDSLMECNMNSNSASDDSSSFSSSKQSISSVETTSDVPKVPARPKPDEILQKCSTVTRRAVGKSLARLSLEGAFGDQQMLPEEREK
ncbi:NADPH oxidase organizer 1-like [Spea bombifrons]|uniref:NADPH oxidase organizer 1-like n=1 Tax=Spea bombifrons TaxID=233779 RepID=UPI00234B3EC3|nr:NADPH oxidase organizer 1-like [Spea bombifrons]